MRHYLLATTLLCVATAAQAQTSATPGKGSVSDCSGNTWSINSSNKILENGNLVLGGGDTAQIVKSGCTISGLSNGQNGSSTSWFTMSSSNPTGYQDWVQSAAPAGVVPAPPVATQATKSAPAAPAAPAIAAPVLAPVAVQSCPASSGGTGVFSVANGQIIGPDGKPWIARGIDVSDFQMGQVSTSDAVTPLLTAFQGDNFVRLAVQSGYNGPGYFAAFIAQLTAKGIVVEIEDHPYPAVDPYTGSQLQAEVAFYAALASAYAGNPYVWFGTMNEPAPDSLPAISVQEAAIYNAIRGAGNNNPILMELPGGGNPGTVGTGGNGHQGNGPMTSGTYAGMRNVVWDLHFYGWSSGYSTDQTTVSNTLATLASQAQTIASGDGVMPVLIGEYGNSTDGQNIDPNSTQVVQAVITAGSNGQYGSAAWAWPLGGGGDNLVDGNNQPTYPYGQSVELYINTDIVPLTQCQQTQQAQAETNTAQIAVAQQQSTPQPADASTTPDPATTQANAQADTTAAQADTLIQQAQTAATPADPTASAQIAAGDANLQAAQAALAGVGH